MITRIGIENFKSIKKIEGLEIKPLTIFTGPNSSGKSNILESIAIFSEAARLRSNRLTENPGIIDVYNQGFKKNLPHRELEKFIAYKKKLANRLITIEITAMPPKEDHESLNSYQESIIKEINKANSLTYSLEFIMQS